ncbi:cobalamin (vitamin B12) biosynthesis CbiX protein [Chloroherpeton thalassium ATCC 35110]|uniref:Cobalamin (Vitamin B12) biosynthesis CbiX protein n=1 Tax=Chloroherpeton thalassium (strain ATCC 35110 / GB-78) TaxID=517418 RepID=B3QXU3_CHLT3|nr:CbiX/SirB N-terminal domain-containing protein [Chloroherpeton thalassium]ACF13471.1 cobalamin (vitamin B12) biosynthesis CbiX protein [Chloroherpeton thalassium ATCC 35110]
MKTQKNEFRKKPMPVLGNVSEGLISAKIISVLMIFALTIAFGCAKPEAEKQETKSDVQEIAEQPSQKIGVLLVNHGSHSKTWRQALLDLEANVKDSILGTGYVDGIKTAFMEYNEPSIATRLKEFDAENYSDVILVPIFLTVSPHSFDDIPTIIGQKEDPQSMEMLKLEKIERYSPKAKTHLAPLLDFTDILQKNVLRRTKALSQNPAEEGVVLIAYGDETYTKQWSALIDSIGHHISKNLGINEYAYGWCGHIARYRSDSTTVAVEKVLRTKSKAVVIPILVAHDENFQVRIIGGGIAKVPDYKNRVIYKPDAILPDENIESWVIHISTELANKIKTEKKEG